MVKECILCKRSRVFSGQICYECLETLKSALKLDVMEHKLQTIEQEVHAK